MSVQYCGFACVSVHLSKIRAIQGKWGQTWCWSSKFISNFVKSITFSVGTTFAQLGTHFVCTNLQHLLVFFYYSMVWEKQKQKNKMLKLSVYFMEGSEILTKCVCWYSNHSFINLLMWYKLDQNLQAVLLYFPILSHVKKPTWHSQAW